MTVYVDRARNPLGRMLMCHMIADTLDELHAMAAAIGMRREWFQPANFPHYDVSLTRRARALKLGAIEVDRRELVRIMRRARMRRDMDLVRDILLVGEAWHDAVIPVFQVPGRNNQVIEAHVKLLVDYGALKSEKAQGGGHRGWRITWAGHEFLDEVRDPEIWNKTKEGAEKVGSWSIKLLGELAAGFVRIKAAEMGLPIG